MKIQVNTDKNIEGREGLVAYVQATVTKALSHFSAQVTRVEVHLSDQNADKSGQTDKRCMMEARLEGRRPNAVTSEAATIEEAIVGAAHKLKSSLESTLGRLHASTVQAPRDDRSEPLPEDDEAEVSEAPKMRLPDRE